MLGLGNRRTMLSNGFKKIVTAGLQLYYKATNTAITNSIKDHSRNSNDGILYSGKALDFDGGNDLVELNDANLPGEFTVCTWVKPDNFTHCVMFGDDANENWIRLQSSTAITVKINNISTNYTDVTHGGYVAQDEWSRVVITRGSDNIVRFGINGVLYSPRNIQRSGNFSFHLLGRKQSTEMNGALADVQVYDKAWNATDLKYDWENPDKDVFDNPNSSIVVTDCKSLLRLNEGAGDRVYDAAPVLGAEEVTNGDFASNTWWTVEAGVEISNGKANFNTTQENYGIARSNFLTTGKQYKVVFTIDSYTGGAVHLNIGGVHLTTPYNSKDTFTAYITGGGSNVFAIQSNSGGAILSINNVSVKEIKPAESFAIVGNKAFIHQQPHIPQYAMSSFSKKMLFDGVNDYVTGSFDGNIGPAKDMTFSCWFSYEDVPTSSTREALFALASSVGDTEPFKKFEVDVVEGNKVIVFTGDGSASHSTSTSSTNSLTVNKLNHIAVSVNDYDASNGVIKIYINGVLDTTTTKPYYGASNVGYYRIGTRVSSGYMLYKGIIDEVSLFKSELTQAEVLELYNSGSSFDTTGHSKYNLGEEVVDGGIDSISNWSFGDGWSLVDGKASLVQVGSPQATDYLKQELTGLVDGRTYVVGFDLDITSATVTTIGLSSTGAFGNIPNVRFHETSGRKTFTGIYDSSHQNGIKELRFVGGSSTEFTIDNVSVQEYGVSGYWRNNGADQWDDLSIGSSHGTVSGSPTEIFLQEVPFFGKDSLGMFMNKPRLGGLNLNTSGYVGIEDNNDLDFGTGAFTMECWVVANFTAQGSEEVNIILSLGGNVASTGTAGLGIKGSTGKIRGYVASEVCDMNGTFTTGQWYHVVTTRDGSGNCKLYIDSTLQNDTETTTGNVSNSHSKFIGKDTNAERFYDGVVDDVKLYNRALTPTEIKKNYNATKSKHKN